MCHPVQSSKTVPLLETILYYLARGQKGKNSNSMLEISIKTMIRVKEMHVMHNSYDKMQPKG